ncbi:PREDICTED: dimethylaniline monooxygenase [N-oxide-forming] 4-like [Calidris pugnax]|uniref:dimethylaniline monooxygenase [N-oxide-forming] 4-like n=1 Tax=Calidris pugnax TaxID=198806 RepID=UPI00071C79AC|nr:PREDICTED: dimethylaniline monooxygenase [N-oxide-forming] 4-like [Calidris pugnax]XP_014798770.1 PREDICTED: dimethylaniline monooxygenase [N-oxide-forming] 4-like [Calidris pugnax]XP_014798772.1 PREDICTED: dimethylaniline monooxygenase [N-oxide-forming] 4-like [Calidris pugnax]
MVRRVAVIGAGAGGLASIKCCLDEGLEPTCFERSEDIGGIWRYTDSTDGGRISVYRSVITNTSKEMSCFSDFPCPENFPSFLPHGLLLEYYRMYAQHFDLLRHIRFKTTAVSVRRRPDFATSGQWEVVTETDGIRESHVFDAVMVCTGHYQEPYLPLASFPGINTRFKGQYLHSWEYKDVEAFRGKRVLVVGVGNTGGDISVELSRVAAKVFLSARSSTWVFSRVSDHGFPFDMVSTTRFNHFLDWLLPSALSRRIRFRKFNSWFNHANYGLASTKSSNFKVIINEELPFCLLSGTVVLKTTVKEFTENSAVFEDGTIEENIDVVLFATGYIFSFPFLEEPVRSLFDDNRSLYKRIFPPQLEKPTLAIIGLVQLTGSVMVGTEMQARWVTGIFAGWNKLPPTSRMIADVLKKKPPVKRNPSERDNLKISFISYTDEIASCAGVKPNVLRLLLTDPRLALAIFFGPCTPYQYRLVGRGKWSGARNAILTQWQRTLKPLRTRVVDDSSSGSSSWCWMCLLALPVALTAGFLLSKNPRPGWSLWVGPQL